MTITAKFASVCSKCGGRVAVGERIDWTRGVPTVSHIECPAQPVPVAPKPAQATAAGAPIVAFLQAAKARGLKAPHVHFLAADGSELSINLATRYTGVIYVKRGGEYLGKVTADGATNLPADVVATLGTIAADPVAAAKAYGALHGRCSFCAQALTDEGSVEVGYGPVCAKRYGLPHKPKGSAAVKPLQLAGRFVGSNYDDAYNAGAGKHADYDHDGTDDYNALAEREAAWRL